MRKKVLIIDDSALMRRLLSDIINSDEQFEAADIAENGLEGLKLLQSGKTYDVILLDIYMPVMDGIEFLEKKGSVTDTPVLIVSNLAKEGGKETIHALELGAIDFLTKPDNLADVSSDNFRRKLFRLLRGILEVSKNPARKNVDRTPADKDGKSGVVSANRKIMHSTEGASKLVALACSTGGPKALQDVIPMLPAKLDAPMLLVQHMPKGFTASLAARLNELSKIHVKEAEDGEVLRKGTVYIAKGGCQMRVVADAAKYTHSLSLTKEAARNGLKPCADIMYESLVTCAFDTITCVVMTGMGADGTQGIQRLKDNHTIYTIAQDKDTCTVYGMPKNIIERGLADEVVPLEKIAGAITKHVGVR